MHRTLIASAIAGALFASTLGGVYAASENHTEPGTPGDANCVGQTMAFLAQVGTEAGIHGIGGIADAANLSVKEVKAIVEKFCTAP